MIVPLAVPLAGLTVSHELLLVAVQAAAGLIVSVNVPLPDAGPTVADPVDKLTAPLATPIIDAATAATANQLRSRVTQAV